MAKPKNTKTPPQEDVRIQEFLDMIAPSIIKFNTDHFIEYVPKSVEIESDSSDIVW